MFIQFKPEYEQGEIVHIHSSQLKYEHPNIHIWKDFEVKEIPDDAMVKLNIGPKQLMVKLTEVLLGDVSFIDFELGNNKNFVCVKCGKETNQVSVNHPRTDEAIPLFLKDERVCQECFLEKAKLTPTSIEFTEEG